jgi:glycosyl transferase family 25
MNSIKHAFYINLEQRPDRKNCCELQLQSVGIQAQRFNAIKVQNRLFGCIMSHLKCLQIAKENEWDHLVIIEDDIEFSEPIVFKEQLDKYLTNKNKMDWDVILFSGNNIHPYEVDSDYCVKVTNCQTITSYMVNNHYFDTLISNIKECVQFLLKESTNQQRCVLDKYWFQMQQKDRWFLITPLTVNQRHDCSVIERQVKSCDNCMLELEKKKCLKIDFIFIIYTCKKNLEKANAMHSRFLSNENIMTSLKMKCLIMYGDDKMDCEHKIVDDKYLIINVEDGYDSLCLKTLKMCKTIYNLYPGIHGLFKCDDDVILNMNAILFFINSLTRFNINYSGFSCMVHEKENNNIHLLARKISIDSQETNIIKTPAAVYCGGPLYYLSYNALGIINKADDNSSKDIFYEDLMIGNILNSKLVYPVHCNLYSDDIAGFNGQPASFHNTNKKHTLFLKIQGGLGNQLFQIASGYGIALKNNMNLFIINDSEIKSNFTHIDDNSYLLKTIFSSFQSINFRLINLEGINYFKEASDNCFTCTDITFNEDTFLNGYFQNEKYFYKHKKTLIELFKKNAVFENFIAQVNENLPLADLLKKGYFIHVRRGDYLKNQELYCIDYDKYYYLALNYIIKKDPDAHFFVLSDDIEYCKTYSLFQNINRSYIELPPLETIYFMSLCSKGGICCNSSFSWWGSYLNETKGKTVLFPSKWINTYWKNDIYYKGSTIIEI